MSTDFEVGARPLDGVCPDCGRVIRPERWTQHRRLAHDPESTPLAPVAAVAAAVVAPSTPMIPRPADGICPDCGKRIGVGLWTQHREHVHGIARTSKGRRLPTTTGGSTGGSIGGSVGRSTSSRPSGSDAADDGMTPRQAQFAALISFAALAVVCFVIYVGDVYAWVDDANACRSVVVRAHGPASASGNTDGCGFFTLVAPLQTVALLVGIGAVVLAVIAPLFAGRRTSTD